MVKLNSGTELGIPTLDDCKVRLSDGVVEDEQGNEWTTDELEEMVTSVKEELEKWEALLEWLKSKPE